MEGGPSRTPSSWVCLLRLLLWLLHLGGKLVHELEQHFRERDQVFRVLDRHDDDLMVCLVAFRSNVVHPSYAVGRNVALLCEILHVPYERIAWLRSFLYRDVHQKLAAG